MIVEDEARLARNIAKALSEQASFAVDISSDGEDGQHMALTNPYDVIVLDLMLPRIDGLTLLKNIRTKGVRAGVLVLTARDATEDVIRGLELGSDDYLTKPFNMGELVARCKALARRAHDRPAPVLKIGDLEINTAARTVAFKRGAVILPALEYRLLEYLAMRAGEVVSKEDILEHLYDFNSENFSNVVEVYISNLRRRFDPGPEHRLIHTVRGQGYLLGEMSE